VEGREGVDEGVIVAKIFVLYRTKKRDDITQLEIPVLRGRTGLRRHQEDNESKVGIKVGDGRR